VYARDLPTVNAELARVGASPLKSGGS
jgi:hypothetical protein